MHHARPHRSHRSAILGAALALLVTLVAPLAGSAPATAQASSSSGLVISEYVEGSSLNKGLELYNTTDAAIDLTSFALEVYANGKTAATATIDLTGTVAPGETFLLADDGASFAGDADQTTTTSLWNGNDALVLIDGTDIIDSFGQVGNDASFAKDVTLRRHPDVCTGDTDADDAFDPAAEYDSFAKDTFDGLGSHTATCGDDGGGTDSAAVINEFSASTTGDDIEYLEVYGDPDTDYSNLTILQVEGDASSGNFGQVVSSHPVAATDADGLWHVDLAANTLQNGTVSLLLVDAWTGGTDVTGDLGTVVDSIGVNDGDSGDTTWAQAELDAAFDGDANTFTPGGASRIPDGADTDTVDDWVRNDFDLAGIEPGTPAAGEAYNTPGAPNEAAAPPPPGGECGADVTLLGAVQGDGDTSPMVDDTVEIEGIVVGDFQTGGYDGYYVQDGGDDDPATSDGVFVFDPATDVASGAEVHVTGTVSEYFGMTQISASSVDVCSTGNDLPPATEVTLPVTARSDLERYEGMHVTFPQDLAIIEYFDFDRFGEIVLGTERQFQPTAVFEPGSPDAVALAEANALSRITLDDGRSGQNPDPAIHPNGDEFTLDNMFRGGDLVTNATGVLDYRFDLYRIQPTQGADFAVTNPRPDVPDVGGDLQVAAFNVLNYFTTIDDGSTVCPDPSVGPEAGCRGADTPEEFDRQEAKIVAALAALDAEVVGLMEIENNDVAVETLVAALNDEVGAGTYAAISTGPIGTDAIKVGAIYQPDAVTPQGDFAILDASVDARFNDDKNRPALAQTFVTNDTGVGFTVAVNHLKSKGSSCEDVGDPIDPDGQGNCNGVRTEAAHALADWLAGDPTGTGADNVLVTGDLNSYDKEDPIDALVAGGYTDLLATYQGEYAYTYVFDGQLGYLDHALANDALAAQVTGVAPWHANTDEVDLIDYDMSFKQDAQDALYAPDPYRASDHDAVVVGLVLQAAYPAWDADTRYRRGDRVMFDGAVWEAAWSTRGREPGDPWSPWQEIAPPGPDGIAAWTPSRIYRSGDQVRHDGAVYEALWFTRNQEPDSPWGPWSEVVAPGEDGIAAWAPTTVYHSGDVVRYDGDVWEARWWNRNREPSVGWGPWRVRQ